MLLGKIEEFCHAQQLIQLKTDKTRGKEELWKFKYFTVQKYNLPKNSSNRRNQNPSRYYYKLYNN